MIYEKDSAEEPDLAEEEEPSCETTDDSDDDLSDEEFNAMIEEAIALGGDGESWNEDDFWDGDDDRGFIPWETLPEMAEIIANEWND
jgi:hypothetical protein